MSRKLSIVWTDPLYDPLYYFGLAHLSRVAFIVEKDKLAYAIPICRLGAWGKLLKPHNLMDLLTQTRFGIGNETFSRAECCFCRFHIKDNHYGIN